eukprot:6213833-Pleurochrysis_carterae.AAC.1
MGVCEALVSDAYLICSKNSHTALIRCMHVPRVILLWQPCFVSHQTSMREAKGLTFVRCEAMVLA